jgi:hypothetical protein
MTFFFPIPNTIFIFGHDISLFSSMPNLLSLFRNF